MKPVIATSLQKKNDEDGKKVALEIKNVIKKKNIFREVQESYYSTDMGDAYLGNSLELLQLMQPNSVDLVVTSPPYALLTQKSYGNVSSEAYVSWFIPFAREVKRVLKDTGSFVIEIGGSWIKGSPTRSIYHYELLVKLINDEKFHLAQEFFWYNPAKMPGPAPWVNIQRIRCTDAVNTIWWLSKTERPKANNKKVLVDYSDSMKKLLVDGYNEGLRPSGHKVSNKWKQDNGGAIPKNLISVSNTSSKDPYQEACRDAKIVLHPARFPLEIPRFFIKFLTDENDVVLDIFGGSNVTGLVSEEMNRQWVSFEIKQNYLESSKYRFGLPVNVDVAGVKEEDAIEGDQEETFNG